MLCALDGAGKIRYNVSTQTNLTSSYAEGVFDYYFFEKNLQGDIIAIYRTDGAKLVTYYYDASFRQII